MIDNIQKLVAPCTSGTFVTRREPLSGATSDEFSAFVKRSRLDQIPAFIEYFQKYSGLSFKINSQGDFVSFLSSKESRPIRKHGNSQFLEFGTQSRTHLMYALREDGAIFATADHGSESSLLFPNIQDLAIDLKITESLTNANAQTWSASCPEIRGLANALQAQGLMQVDAASSAFHEWWCNEFVAVSVGRCRQVRCPYKRRYAVDLYWRESALAEAQSVVSSFATSFEPHILTKTEAGISLEGSLKTLHGLSDLDMRFAYSFRLFVCRELNIACDVLNEIEFKSRLSGLAEPARQSKRYYLVCLGSATLGIKEFLFKLLELMPAISYNSAGWGDFGWGIESLNLLLSRFAFCLPEQAGEAYQFLKSVEQRLKWNDDTLVYSY